MGQEKWGGKWHGYMAFMELWFGAGEQTLPSCLMHSSAEAEQDTLQGHYRRHTGVGVPCVLFWSYICCAKGNCQGIEVVMEFSSWGDSKKLQCMWKIIEEIKPEASLIVLCRQQTSGGCSHQAESHLCYYESASAEPCLTSALKIMVGMGWGLLQVLPLDHRVCKRELVSENKCRETFLMMFIVPLWVGAVVLSFFHTHRIET